MSLSANQEKSEMKRMTWKVEGEATADPTTVRGGPVNVLDLVVELSPMGILLPCPYSRHCPLCLILCNQLTFKVSFKHFFFFIKMFIQCPKRVPFSSR